MTTPEAIDSLDILKVNQIATGDHHVIILATNYQLAQTYVMTWGKAIVNGTMSDQSIPTHINSLNHIRYIQASTTHSIAINHKHRMYAFGYNQYGELGNGQEGIQAIMKSKIISKDITPLLVAPGHHFTMLLCQGQYQPALSAVDLQGEETSQIQQQQQEQGEEISQPAQQQQHQQQQQQIKLKDKTLIEYNVEQKKKKCNRRNKLRTTRKTNCT